MAAAPDRPDPASEHERRRQALTHEAERLSSHANRLSVVNLGLFVAAVVVGISAISQGNDRLGAGAAALFCVFAVLMVLHRRLLARRDLAEVRCAVHRRHLARLSGDWLGFPSTGEGLLPTDHPYAHDIDVVGIGSLFQRIDVTHTPRGEQLLAAWLGAPASPEIISARRAAVEEIAERIELRQELEAAVEIASGHGKLDAAPFLEFTIQPPFFVPRPWLLPAIHVLPVVLIGAVAAGQLGLLPAWAWLAVAGVQAVVSLAFGRRVAKIFDLVAARRGFAEAFHRMLLLVERETFESPLLRELQKRTRAGDVLPSVYMRRLDRWVGLADLRTQFLVHLPVNVLLLWDLHVLWHLDRWNQDVGRLVADVFDALGSLEALSSLATLRHGDPSTTFAEIGEGDDALTAEGLAHPLLPLATRVPNDVPLRGPGTGLIVTGSNMAGKSTLLRSVGLNVALALAGGPVCASAMRVPPVRLRASMRAEDSLQQGASYFHAELTKLRRVVADLDGVPVMFLLDELLRGTNAHARHIGARAVLMHLLDRRACGMVATHDVALSELEHEHPERISNSHFTDVVQNGEMTFDYKLRPGVVRTSNALRLLRLAGIDVPDDDSVG